MITLDTETIYSVSDAPQIIQRAIKRGTCYKQKGLSYYNMICAFDIETSSIKAVNSDNEYKDIYIYNYLKGMTIKCPDIDISNFTTQGIKISNTKGYNLDTLYMDICNLFPGFITDGLNDPQKQLAAILKLFIDNTPVPDDISKYSIMYCWQFAIDGKVIFGRTWSEFLNLIDIISQYSSNKKRIICYVHNLAYEFQFIRTFFQWSKVFSIATRKPIYAITESGIEFRCSYILTNYSLAKLADQLRHYKISKLIGSLDYKLHRSPESNMTDQEIRYCINDVLVVSAYIQECIMQERYICNIPLTAPGYCRRFCRNMCLYGTNKKGRNAQFNKYSALMKSMKISGKDEYLQLKRCFQGGFTHASTLYSGLLMHGVSSIDFTSSYPYVLMSEMFPMSSGKLVTPKSTKEFEHYLRYYCCIFDATFTDIQPKYINDNYISTSHCIGLKKKTKKQQANYIDNNGRLVSCNDSVTMTITNVDYELISKTYSYKKLKINNMRIYRKAYLPKELILSIIKLYQDKTTLKGVKGKETEYLNGKALLNAVFGMMVTYISKDEIIYSDTWSIEHADIEKDIKKYNESPKRFLFYPWGVFCTAYARYNLWRGILEFGDDYIYADTDSIKCLNLDKHMQFVDDYNYETQHKLKCMCKFHKIDYSLLCPKTVKGEVKLLGVWDIETPVPYKNFKTLGAKRYLVEDDEHIEMTVAGINKKIAVPYMIDKYGKDNVFYYFRKDLYIPCGKTGKLTHVYIDQDQSGSFTDYQGKEYTFYNEPPGVYLEEADYSFGIEQDYLEYIKGVQYRK